MTIFAQPCPWYVAGPLLGLLVAGLLWTIDKPLGARGGYVDSVKWLVEREEAGPTWRAWFLRGIVIGGAFSMLAAGTWHPTLSYGAFTSSFGAILGAGGAVLFAAGMLIGYGARLGGGCTSGHGRTTIVRPSKGRASSCAPARRTRRTSSSPITRGRRAASSG